MPAGPENASGGWAQGGEKSDEPGRKRLPPIVQSDDGKDRTTRGSHPTSRARRPVAVRAFATGLQRGSPGPGGSPRHPSGSGTLFAAASCCGPWEGLLSTDSSAPPSSDAPAERRPQAPEGGEGIRVLVLHDHPVMRRGFEAVLAGQEGLQYVGSGPVGAATRVRSAAIADVAVLGLTSALAVPVLRQLAAQHPQLRLLAVTGRSCEPMVAPMLGAGAHGCIAATAPVETVLEAIRCIGRGQLYLCDRAVDQHEIDEASRPGVALLSQRELEVFELIAHGRSISQIAASLGVSVKTVEKHRERIKQKLDVRSSAELVVKAVEMRLAGE